MCGNETHLHGFPGHAAVTIAVMMLLSHSNPCVIQPSMIKDVEVLLRMTSFCNSNAQSVLALV